MRERASNTPQSSASRLNFRPGASYRISLPGATPPGRAGPGAQDFPDLPDLRIRFRDRGKENRDRDFYRTQDAPLRDLYSEQLEFIKRATCYEGYLGAGWLPCLGNCGDLTYPAVSYSEYSSDAKTRAPGLESATAYREPGEPTTTLQIPGSRLAGRPA